MMSQVPDAGSLDLLQEPLLPVREGDAPVGQSLPEVLARLLACGNAVQSFDGLAAEQQSHWYRFLVRCAARALKTIGSAPAALTGAVADKLEGEIRDALAAAAGVPTAWQLVPGEASQAGFLQVPLVAGRSMNEDGYSQRPIGILSALIGSKEFERKSEAARELTPAEVTYALVEFQSGVIFGGRGNYETPLTPSRSGKGSGVPFMGVRLPGGLGATFRWDVAVLLNEWEHIQSVHGLAGDVWAVWATSWDGSTPLAATNLDPAFIPLARMVRLAPPNPGGRFDTVYFRPSKGSRVSDHTGGALLGDIFTPTVPNPKDVSSRKVRGVMDGGFSYPEVARLLGLEGVAGEPSTSVRRFFDAAGSDYEEGVGVLFEGVAFEQGKTLGFYRRELLLPVHPGARLGFRDPEPYREVHSWMLERVRAAKKVLRAASRVLLTGEARPRPGDESLVDIGPQQLDQFAEEGDTYLMHLFLGGAQLAIGDESYQETWDDWVTGRARLVFRHVMAALPTPGAQRLRREVDAEDYLEFGLRRLRGGDRDSAVSTPGQEATV